jgi:hypothetical protein
MGFLNAYLKNHILDTMPDSQQANLEKLEKVEQNLENQISGTSGTLNFEEIVKQHGPEIADLVSRASEAFKNIEFSFSKFRVIINIGVEVYQMVEEMGSSIVTDTMTPEEKQMAKIKFGQELIYFIYLTIDPLKNVLNWVPFKSTLEKKIVKWLSGLSLSAAVDFLKSKGIEIMSVNRVKALPDVPKC